MSDILEQIEQIQTNVREIKSTWGNTIMTLDNIKSGLKADVQKKVDEAYQRGLEDAWEAARKLFSSMADSDIEKAFPIEWNNGGFEALMNLQPQEAIAKLKAYEEHKDDSIKVGDEVATKTDKKYTVVSFGTGTVCGFNTKGMWSGLNPKEVTKTGKHYDIQSILEAMRT